MTKNMLGFEKIRQLVVTEHPLRKRQWFLVLFFSIVIYLSLGLGSYEPIVYRATIGPTDTSNGSVKVVFYGSNYEDYLASGALHIPTSGWNVTTASDSTTLTAEDHAAPLVIYSEGEPIEVGLLHYADAGVARLLAANNYEKLINLWSSQESVSTLTIGGSTSDVLQSGEVINRNSIFKRLGIFIFILTMLTLIAQTQLKNRTNESDQAITAERSEVAYFALPLLASTAFVLFAYWPGNVAYDGSLQWYQAVTRGNIDAPLGISATLFLRLFTHISASPAWVIIAQSSLSAIGVALILKELRYRGISRWVAQTFSILLAIQPQYPLFFTNLGKDALSAVGIIFFAWSLLSITRNLRAGRLKYFSILVLIAAAMFSGIMRVNVIPATVFTIFIFAIFLFLSDHRTAGLTVLVAFFLTLIFIPKLSFFLSDEQQSSKAALSEVKPTSTKSHSQDTGLPLGLAANFYIYHLFSAAAHSGIPLQKSEEDLFFKIAPRSAWEKYDCFMTDTTFISISEGMLLNQTQYHIFLKEHQLDLAEAVLNILKNNPSVLIKRQICISKMLWYIGYEKKPFQTTSTLGYDNVTDEFKLIAGENKSLFSEKSRTSIKNYVLWSENKSNFWFFWKPALIFYIGLFCALFRLTTQRDIGLILMLSLPLVMTFVLAFAIPFPAYRYAYPATLLMSLLCTLALSSANSQLPRPKQSCL